MIIYSIDFDDDFIYSYLNDHDRCEKFKREVRSIILSYMEWQFKVKHIKEQDMLKGVKKTIDSYDYKVD